MSTLPDLEAQAPRPRDVDLLDDGPGMSVADMLAALRRRWLLLVFGPLAAGLASVGVTALIAPTFTANTTFMPPQQAQSAAASALASLGPLAGLAGGASGARNSGEQYVSLMQSATVSDRIIDQFKLMDVYEAKLRIDARIALTSNVRIALGKKDGLISVAVDDKSPQRAADIANRYVDELRRFTSTLAVTEAQQRRVFFERQLQQSRDKLLQAQQALQASGFNPGALKAEPKAAAEGYARLKAELTAAEIRLQTLRGALADNTPEVRQQLTTIGALAAQLARSEQASQPADGPDYVGKYREFKYQETLFELYARQFELARVDESREGALIQIVDAATVPEKKSRPKRAIAALLTTALTALALAVFVVVRAGRRNPGQVGAATGRRP